MDALKQVQRQSDLPQIVLAAPSPRGFPGALHRRQQQARQDPDDGDHDEQLHQRESPTDCHGPTAPHSRTPPRERFPHAGPTSSIVAADESGNSERRSRDPDQTPPPIDEAERPPGGIRGPLDRRLGSGSRDRRRRRGG